MLLTGDLRKMRSEYAEPVRYFLRLSEEEVLMNGLIGKPVHLSFTGKIHCVSCGKEIRKAYGEGFCFQCFQKAPEASESIIRPELSKAHLGVARDIEWAVRNDLIEHFVYLSVTDKLKVGVTRFSQIPTRWIDQGAVEAIRIASVPNRHIAGVIEVWLKKFYADKTEWKGMLRNQSSDLINLVEEKNRAIALLPTELRQYELKSDEITNIRYPVGAVSEDIRRINLGRHPEVTDVLSGIKGQYLIFQSGYVFNVRNHSGYQIKFEY